MIARSAKFFKNTHFIENWRGVCHTRIVLTGVTVDAPAFEYDLKIVNYKNSDRISSKRIMCLAYVWQIHIASTPGTFQ